MTESVRVRQERAAVPSNTVKSVLAGVNSSYKKASPNTGMHETKLLHDNALSPKSRMSQEYNRLNTLKG